VTRVRSGAIPSRRMTSRRVDSEGARTSRARRATVGTRVDVSSRFLKVWHSGMRLRLMSWMETT
jgi:hypothetical protein